MALKNVAGGGCEGVSVSGRNLNISWEGIALHKMLLWLMRASLETGSSHREWRMHRQGREKDKH